MFEILVSMHFCVRLTLSHCMHIMLWVIRELVASYYNIITLLWITILSFISIESTSLLYKFWKMQDFSLEKFLQAVNFSNWWFSLHILAWACVLWFTLSSMLVFLISQSRFLQIPTKLSYFTMYFATFLSSASRTILRPITL